MDFLEQKVNEPAKSSASRSSAPLRDATHG
jgi:hypothetical protein